MPMLRDMVLRYAIDFPNDLSDRIYEALGPEPLENLFALRHVAISPCVRRPGDLDLAEMILAEELAKLTAAARADR